MAINSQGQFAARMGLAAGSSQLAHCCVVAHSGTSSWIGAACLFWAVTESSRGCELWCITWLGKGLDFDFYFLRSAL